MSRGAAADQLTWADVIVVGAGPAGASAAHALAKRHSRVILFEKEALPRYKTCGGGLLHRAVRLLDADVSAAVERACWEASIGFADHRWTFRTKRPEPIVYMTMRPVLDHKLATLAQTAGACLVQQCAVRELEQRESCVIVQTTAGRYAAQFIIAADGANSGIAKKVGWSVPRHIVPAVEYEIKVPERDLARFQHTARFDFEIVPQGYAWVFPKKDHLSIGALTWCRSEPGLHRIAEEYLRYLGLTEPEQVERHGYFIPLRPRSEPLARNRVFLVGDAAGLADPVTAEGMTHAIASGQFAADAILESAGCPQTAASLYQQRLAREIVAELRLARRLARALYCRPRFVRWMFKRFGQQLAEAVTDIVTGEQSYRTTLKRALRFWRWAL